MSRIITPSPGPELRREEQRQDDRHREARIGDGDEDEGQREQHATEGVGRPESDPPSDPRRDDRADQTADGTRSECQAQRARADAEECGGVQDHERGERQVEEIDRGRGQQDGRTIGS